MKILNIKTLRTIACLMLTMGAIESKAQLTGFHSAYFANEYINNPAMAGLREGLTINLGYQAQWTSMPGGPKLQNFSGEYNAGNRVGWGVIVNADQAGLINRTRAMATYAYHVPLNGEQDKLNFGLSFGLNSTYIDYSKIIGDPNDVQTAAFNNRSTYLDGDIGASYTSSGLNVQASLPNLKTVLFPNENENLNVNRSTFFTAASYKIPYDNFIVEPKVAFRGVKGFDNVIDGGFNVDLSQYNFGISGLYHSNKTITAGLVINLKTTDLLLAYTNNTGPLRSYANNTFEFGLKLKLFR